MDIPERITPLSDWIGAWTNMGESATVNIAISSSTATTYPKFSQRIKTRPTSLFQRIFSWMN
jgi:hypothetical protein